MKTDKIYLSQHDLYTLNTKISEEGIDEQGAFFIPEATIVHPRGGGQAMDTAYVTTDSIAQAKITHALSGQGGVKHYYISDAKLLPHQEVTLMIDQIERQRSSLLHTAGHLLSDVVERYTNDGMRALKASHYEGECFVYFTGELSEPKDEFLESINAEMTQAISGVLPISSYFMAYSEYIALHGIPDARVLAEGEPVRMIEIRGHKANACGGTHLTDTGHLAGLTATKLKMKNGEMRISYKV